MKEQIQTIGSQDNSEDLALLKAAAYQCENFVPDKDTISGYTKQCSQIHEPLEQLIESHMKNGKTLILEGIHLDPAFNEKMINKYGL